MWQSIQLEKGIMNMILRRKKGVNLHADLAPPNNPPLLNASVQVNLIRICHVREGREGCKDGNEGWHSALGMVLA